jgi:hypothetical protein
MPTTWPWTKGGATILGEAQHRDEILARSEFDYPFPRFDILPKEGVVILCQ